MEILLLKPMYAHHKNTYPDTRWLRLQVILGRKIHYSKMQDVSEV
jgi:hypothetical protein